jgi:monoamine oxidase
MLDTARVEVVVVGAGLAGLVTTLELLECRNSRALLAEAVGTGVRRSRKG